MSRRQKPKKAEPKPKIKDFNLTPQGFLIKSSNVPDKTAFFDSKMASYENQLTSMDVEYAYETAIGKIKVVFDEVTANKRKPISCKAGCSACCHLKVDIVPFEAELIKNHVIDNGIKFDRERLAIQTRALKLGVGAYEQLPFEERQCIFLNSEQRCSIYSVRPLMCRRHFVQSDPAFCRTQDFSRIELDVNPDVDAYLSAYVTKNPPKPLAEFIQDHLTSFKSEDAS